MDKNYAEIFKEYFEEYEQSPPNSEDLLCKMSDLVEEWQNECPDDYNFHCARILVLEPTLDKYDVGLLAIEAAEFNAADQSLNDWYRNHVLSLMLSK